MMQGAIALLAYFVLQGFTAMDVSVCLFPQLGLMKDALCLCVYINNLYIACRTTSVVKKITVHTHLLRL